MLCILELALTHLHNMHVQGVRKILSNGKVRQNTLLCNASFIQKIFVCIIATVKTKNQNCENRRSGNMFRTQCMCTYINRIRFLEYIPIINDAFIFHGQRRNVKLCRAYLNRPFQERTNSTLSYLETDQD